MFFFFFFVFDNHCIFSSRNKFVIIASIISKDTKLFDYNNIYNNGISFYLALRKATKLLFCEWLYSLI